MSDVMIEARDLTKRYGPNNALQDVSFEVRKGEVLGFLGPNGAGKTTTMKILTCFIAPTRGQAKVNGCDIYEDPMGVRAAVGYLPESTPLYPDMLVYEYLEFIAKMRGFTGSEAKKRIKAAAEQTSLEDVIAKEIRALSKGFKQRVGLAQALVHEPPVLILDEPMSGLDPNQAAEIRDLIREIGKERTVILSTHDLGEVEVTCGRVLIVANGNLVADDRPEDLRVRAGKAAYTITFAKSGKSDKEIRAALGKVKHVDVIKPKSGEKDETVFLVTAKGSEDLRADLFRFAVDQNLTMLGLVRKSAGLDSVFRELTTKAAEAGGGRKGARAARLEKARQRKRDREAAKAKPADDGETDDRKAGKEEE